MKLEKMSSKKTVKVSGLVVFLFVIFSVAFFGASDLIFGVKIKNVNIQDGAKMPDSVLRVTGNAKNAISLSLNGREISINNAGDFDETIALLSGYNIVNIKARDKFGYVDEKNYKLMH